MKRATILLIFFSFSGLIYAQSLSVTSSNAKVEKLNVYFGGQEFLVTDFDGSELISVTYTQPGSPSSLKAYLLAGGGFIVRENIANFLIYDSFGNVLKSISNSTQSEEGEAISELAMDDFGKTIVVFNPKIIQDGVIGSRAKIIDNKRVPFDVFYSEDRVLSVVQVSANGEFIAFASTKFGTDDEVQLMDRFGNILNTISFDQDVKGVTFSENGLYVTIFSGGRAAVYQVCSGERVGSTSFRSTSVIFADYSHADKTIVGLTGNGNSTLSNIQLHAINVLARKIARQGFDGTLSINGQIKMGRTGKDRYLVTGLDRQLNLRVSF